MAKYNVTVQGKTYQVDGVADPAAAVAKVTELISSRPQNLPENNPKFDHNATGQAANVGDAMLFGGGSEIAGLGAGAKELYNQATGGWNDYSWPAVKGAYSAEEETMRRKQQDFSQENPIADVAGKVTGSLMGGPMKAGGAMYNAASKLPNLVKYGAALPAIGAIEGGASGALYSPQGERQEGAESGAKIGAALGVALPAAGYGLKKGIIDPVMRRVKPRAFNETAILKALQRDELTPDQAKAKLAQLGNQGMLADIGEGGELARLARAADTTGGLSSQAKRELEQRASGAGERVMQTIKKITGSKGDFYSTLDDLNKGQKQISDKLYKEARAQGATMTPEIQAVLKRSPELVDMMEQAKVFAKREGRELPDLFQTNSKGQTTIAQGVDFDVFDDIKRAMDARIEPSRDAITGKLNLSDPNIASMNTLKRDFLEAVDAANPAYKQARAAYAGGARQKDALKAGREFMRGDPELLEQQIGKMSVDEKAAFIEGVTRSVSDMVDNNMNATNVVNQLLKKPRYQKSLKAAFDDSKQYLEFVKFLKNESQFARTKQTITGGSQTANKLLEVDRFFKDPSLADAAANLATGRTAAAGGNMMQIIKNKLGAAGLPEAQARDLEILIQRDPKAAMELLDRIARPSAAIEGSQNLGLLTAPSAASVAAPYSTGLLGN